MCYAFLSSLPVSISQRPYSAKTQRRIAKRIGTHLTPTVSKLGEVSRRTALQISVVSTLVASLKPSPVLAGRPEGVNRPELLPKEFTTVLDYENFLARGEEERLREKLADLETRTGYKVRVLTQRFPQTPGLAVRSFWDLDDNSVLLVADYFGGDQLLKFNVGKSVDVKLPPIFWSRLSSGLGNKFYVDKNGEAAAILTAVDNIRSCLLSNNVCSTPPYMNDNKF